MPLNKLIKGASHKAFQNVPEIGKKKKKPKALAVGESLTCPCKSAGGV